MTLAIAASVGASPGSMDLAVSGAAHVGTSFYDSNFTAGVNSWSGGTSSDPITPSVQGNISTLGVKALRIGNGANPFRGTSQYAARTVTGLTIGQVYRVTALMLSPDSGGCLASIGVSGIGSSDPAPLISSGWTPVQYDFTATATSHDLRVTRQTALAGMSVLLYDVHVRLLSAGALAACVIERLDANGAHFVRLHANQDVDTSGLMSVTDWELAMVGSVQYIVRDGLGNLASTTTSIEGDTPNPLLSSVGLEAVLDVDRIDGWEEALEYAQLTVNVKAVIGRGNAVVTQTDDYGWTKRQGTLTLFAETYFDARRLAATYTAGRVALLRQPTYGDGFDLYHVAQRIRTAPSVFLADADDPAGSWRWPVEVDYIETGWPDGPLGGSSDWTYAAVDASYLAYFDLVRVFTTYADLLANTP